ncbi:Clp protease N-terminal domain-containing protein [Nonomuraea sp. NPDC050643]|uniref:Clp protease N-terminal domain-containing protein n=1 Tax=Nonomuraea sp. NPDC050643 TaxID=3155660 RepID=UPI0033F16144
MRAQRCEPGVQRARLVIILAQEEARAFQHDHIGSEHILLGFIQENDGTAARVLKDMGVSLEETCCVIEEVIAGRSRPAIPESVAGMSERTRRSSGWSLFRSRREPGKC